MLSGKKDHAQEELDRIGQEILRVATMSDEECDQAVSSPFLLARVRARIAAEKERRETGTTAWMSFFPVLRRAIPVMILITLSAVGASWYLQTAGPVDRPSDNTVLYPDPHGERVAPISACAISTKDECSISTDDVLATLVNGERQEVQK
ncbi:MAG TPA: hypothetical protein VNH22_05200 [Blastocatellia bacterium]|jgi:hypothetical protein|nr:hypothetical protein [Blastocatellia bacterium]